MDPPYAVTAESDSIVFLAKVTGCAFMKESEQRALFVRGLQCVVIPNNAVNVKIAQRALSEKNVLMVRKNHNLGIAEVVNIVNILGSDACVMIVMVVLCANIIR